MLDHEAHNSRNELGRTVTPTGAAADRPLADREVPLPGLAAADDPTMLAIHQWLDGEATEAEARRADGKQVDMWKLVATDTQRRRQSVTPSHVMANLMSALPEKQVVTQMAAPTATATTNTTIGLPFTMVVAVGTSMLILGIVIGKMIG